MHKTSAYALGTLTLSLGAALVLNSPLRAQPGAQDDHRPERRTTEGNGPRRPPRLDGPRLEDMTQMLKLTTQQQQKIKAILDATQKQIEATLTPEQRDKMQQLRQPPGPPRDGFGPPPDSFGPPDGPDGFPGVQPNDLNGPPPQDEDHGRPVAQVAKELGVTPEQFRAAFKKVHPAGPGQQPTEAQRRANRKVLAETLGVSPERLDEVMDKYRPGGRGTNWPPRPRQGPPPGRDGQGPPPNGPDGPPPGE